MTFLPLPTYDELSPDAKAASDRLADERGGEFGNVRATLLANLPGFEVYSQWYTLHDEIAPWIGERAVSLFSYAISDENDSLACAVYFRRILLDGGDDPDHPEVTETERLLMDWGRLIAASPRDIPGEFYARLESAFSPERRLTLLAFAGLTVAINVLVSVGRIPLDESLYPYRKPGDERIA